MKHLWNTQYLILYINVHNCYLKPLNERLSCTEMYIADEALVEHEYLILYINVHHRSRSNRIYFFKNRRTLDVDELPRDASTLDNNISSVVNKVGLLTIERIELFSCVDCA